MTVYIAQAANGDVKIGHSRNVPQRIAGLSSWRGRCRLIATLPGGRDQEAIMHAWFGVYQIEREWFSPVMFEKYGWHLVKTMFPGFEQKGQIA